MPPSSESKVRPRVATDGGLVPAAAQPSVGWVVKASPREREVQGAGRAADEATDAARGSQRAKTHSRPGTYSAGGSRRWTALRGVGRMVPRCPACVMMGHGG